MSTLRASQVPGRKSNLSTSWLHAYHHPKGVSRTNPFAEYRTSSQSLNPNATQQVKAGWWLLYLETRWSRAMNDTGGVNNVIKAWLSRSYGRRWSYHDCAYTAVLPMVGDCTWRWSPQARCKGCWQGLTASQTYLIAIMYNEWYWWDHFRWLWWTAWLYPRLSTRCRPTSADS